MPLVMAWLCPCNPKGSRNGATRQWCSACGAHYKDVAWWPETSGQRRSQSRRKRSNHRSERKDKTADPELLEPFGKPVEAGAKNQTPTPWVPSTPARKVQALAPTTPNPTTAPEENSQMLEKLQHLKQVVTEKGVGDAAMMETIGALEEAAKNQPVQPLKLTHKDVTQLQKAENSLVTLREQVGKLDTQWQEWDKYIKEKYDEQLQLYRTKRDTLVEKFKEQKEKVSTLKDKMKKAAAEAESKAEAEQSLPAVEIKEFVAGEKVDLTGLGDTDDELMEEVRPPRREESRRRQPQELAYEGRTQHVRFSPELAVSIFDEDGAPDSATFSFKLWEGELENWDSKPWALYGGPYVEAAGSAFSSSTLGTDDTLRGVGMSSASDRRTQLDHNLFHQLRDVQGDGLLPAVLEGQLPREDLLQVRLCTFGCLHSYLGRRNRIAVRVDEAPLAAFLIDEIYDMWKDITPSRLRIQIVHPQPEDFTAIPTIYVVVDFGEQGVDVPVLIDRRSYNDYGSSRHLSVAYLPPRATWHSIVRGCELHHQCRSRVRNQCIMKIGFGWSDPGNHEESSDYD